MDRNEQIVQEVYRNARMGGDSIVDLLDKVGDQNLRSEMTGQLEKYRSFEREASEMLCDRGLKPEDLSMMAKAGAKAGMFFNTMLDVSTSHIAEMMMNGANMGIISLEKKLNECTGEPSSPEEKAGEAPKNLADRLLKFEKSSLDSLAQYL